jgi:hypothetical protein
MSATRAQWMENLLLSCDIHVRLEVDDMVMHATRQSFLNPVAILVLVCVAEEAAENESRSSHFNFQSAIQVEDILDGIVVIADS